MTTTLLLEASDIRDSTHWYWRLTDADGNFIAAHTVALDAADWRYEACCDLYGWLERRVTPDKRREEQTRLLAELGPWIGEQALGPIAPALAERSPVTARVRIPAEPPAAAGLCYLPLELAYVNGKPLAVQEVSLVFEVGQPAPVRLQPVGDRLRMLAVFSLPTGENALNLRQERYRLKKLIRELTAARGWAVDLRVAQYGVTRQALREMLEEGEGWDVLHFSGHGLAAKIVLEQADGRPDVVTAAELVKLLRLSRGWLKWVTLSACLSAAVTAAETLRWLGLEPTRRFGESASDEITTGPLPALAQTLVENLNCAVLAMRYPVEDNFAIDLGERLYRGVLEKGQPLARALQLALPDALEKTTDYSPLSVATPALFGAAVADLTLRVPKSTRKRFETATTGLARFPPEPPLFVGRVGALAQASAALAPESGRSGALFYGMAGAGKTYCALELVYHYEGLQRFQGYVWYKAPEQDKDISQALLNFALAMEQQLPGFKMVHLVERQAEFDAFLPWLTEQLEQESILLALDNLESLLRPDGRWRDERWGRLVAALLNHRGLSRVILTSRIRPVMTGIPSDALLELPIHTLSLDETALLARQSTNLGRLLRGDGVTDGRRRDHQRQVVLEALRLVQGHPKLLDLADRQAVDLATLERQLNRAGAAWSAGRDRLDAFFQQGESTLADTDFLQTLADWTELVAATLPAAAQDLFHFLCCLEENDRQDWIVEANWAYLWRQLERAGELPALAEPLAALTTAGLVAVDTLVTDNPTASAQVYRLHPGIAEAGRRRAGDIFQTAVDAELAAFWRAVYDQAEQEEMQGAGGRLVHAGRAAAPYLLRQRRWAEASALLERALIRDHSPATVAAALPLLEQIAAATAGTERELIDVGVLAKTLYRAGRWQEAEDPLRALLNQAVQQQAFRLASGIAGELINLLQATGRAREALALVDQKQNYTRRAGLGPWTQLNDENQRLKLLVELGQNEEALAAVERLRPILNTLLETSNQKEMALPWAVRETVLETGRKAAMNLKRWEDALALNAAVLQSKSARHAPALEQDRTRFNNYGPLLALRRYAEARAVLEACRAAFAAENAVVELGAVFSALANLEDNLNHPDRAIALEHTALRYSYLAGDPNDCAISHFNLANYLWRAGGPPAVALAHRLAAVMIWFQTASGQLKSWLPRLTSDLIKFPTNPPLPSDFAALCAIVEQVEGVRFRDLFERLPQDRAASGDEALQQALALARRIQTA